MTREEKLNHEYEVKLAALRREQEAKLAELHREQSSCQHAWGEVTYDPEYKNKPIYEPGWQGVDYAPKLVGSEKVKKDRWSKTCSKCGKVEYAYALKPVKYEPDFK